MTEEIDFTEAKREGVGLLIGLAGASGSGKTKSALELATGLAGPDGLIFGIDTEAGRMKHYAAEYKFRHGDLKAPFTPQRYLAAIEKAEAAGAAVIVVDSASHEWEGEGGLHDMHNAVLDAQVEAARKRHTGGWEFDAEKTADRLSVGAWRDPKNEHKAFVRRLLQCRAHIILCFRADEKMRIEKVKDDRGRDKTVIVQAKDLPPKERWTPICERRLPYELTLSIILTPHDPGIPIPVKLQDQHRPFLPLDQYVTAEAGRKLAAWARGDTPSQADPEAVARAIQSGDIASQFSTMDPLELFWRGLPKDVRQAVGGERLAAWKAQIAVNMQTGA